jgi:hypothetical protein
VKRQLRIDLPEHLLKSIYDLPVPRDKLWAAVYVSRLVDFILLEPPGYPAWSREVGSFWGEKSVVQG